MELQGTWIYNYIKTYGPAGLRMGRGSFSLGGPGALEGLAIVEADVLVIPAGAKNPKEAFEFLRLCQFPKPMEKLCLRQSKFQPLREVQP